MNATRRLDPLLNLHRLRRRVLKQLLAALRAQHLELSRRLEELCQEWARVRAWKVQGLAAGLEAHPWRLSEHWTSSAERQSSELTARLSEVGAQVQDAERRLLRASQELKMLSTLQERRAAREKELEQRREQRDLDEMASRCGGRP